MTVEGCDYAFSNPSPSGLYAAGKRFAMRYVGPGSDNKLLHAAERDEIWAAGLDVVLLAEGATDGALGGFPVGKAHAASALSGARALGAPDSLPIYFAVDFDVTSSQWPTVAAYLNGCASVLGASRVGVYGGFKAMQWADRDKVATWFFQTFAWSFGQWYFANHVEQYQNGVALAGGTVDLCRAVKSNYGQWGPNGGGDMANVSDQDWQALIYRVEAILNNRPTVQGGPTTGERNLLHDAIAALSGGVSPVPPVSGAVDLTDASIAKIADAVVDEEHNRLAE